MIKKFLLDTMKRIFNIDSDRVFNVDTDSADFHDDEEENVEAGFAWGSGSGHVTITKEWNDRYKIEVHIHDLEEADINSIHSMSDLFPRQHTSKPETSKPMPRYVSGIEQDSETRPGHMLQWDPLSGL